jgi:hypothetical protein
MKRRRFLVWLASALVLAVGLLVVTRERLKELLLASSLGHRARETFMGVDPSQGTSDLTPEDQAALWSLAAIVLPSTAGEQARPVVLERLTWRAREQAGYASEFRRAVDLLNRESRKTYGRNVRFAALGGSQATAVVGSLLEGIVDAPLSAASRGTVLRLVISPRFLGRYRMRRHVVNEILDAYYRSPLGWARLGYRSFPGACAGLEIYSRPPELT